MTQVSVGERIGVQVICIRRDTSLLDLATGVLDDARRMVDNLELSELPGGGVAVTVVKWAGRGQQRIDRGYPLAATRGGN
ncbi:MAG: hypothetical protein P8129_22620 [Anaerolineae bacterium]